MPKTGERVKIIGHRGWPARFPDNCQAGVMAAARVADMVEVDLRLSADEVVVLSHDSALRGVAVASSTWSDLMTVDLGDGHHPVRLSDLLAEPGLVPLDLEVKNMPGEVSEEQGRQLARLVADMARPGDVVTSFWWPGMDELRVSHPQVHTGLIVAAEGDLIDAIDHAAERGHAWVVPYWALVRGHAGAVETAAHSGVEVIVWGLEEPSEVANLVVA
ncbi:MAG TPA: glycerophosphodiester phosphodiesterase, partial [Acidimicrobiia bacterium]